MGGSSTYMASCALALHGHAGERPTAERGVGCLVEKRRDGMFSGLGLDEVFPVGIYHDM